MAVLPELLLAAMSHQARRSSQHDQAGAGWPSTECACTVSARTSREARLGYVDILDDGVLLIRLEGREDSAALRAALRSGIDPDPVTVPEAAGEVRLDPNHVEHFLIARACGFAWSERALSRAVDELAPYARQASAMHCSVRLKSNRRWMQKLSEERRTGRAPGPTGLQPSD